MAENHHGGRKQAPEWLGRAAGPILLLLISIGFFWKLVLSNQYTWLEGSDTAYQVLPWFQFQAGEWHRGSIPLWDPYLWGGQSLIGQAQPGAAYPPNWLLFLLPLRNGWIRQSFLHWYYVLIHFHAALFCYWLCRDLKRSQSASLLAGIVFAFGGFVGTTDWPQMLNGAVWAPAVFLFFLRAMRGQKPLANAAGSGACLGAAFLAGHHQIPVFTTMAVGGAWLYYLFRDGFAWRLLRLLAVFGVFLVLVSAMQTLPAYEYGQTALRWVSAKEPVSWNQPVPYSVHARYSLGPISLLGIVIPGIHFNADPFMGLVAVILALAALQSWREPVVRLFAAMALGGLLFSLGENSVFHGFLYAVTPIVEKARNPSMAIFIFNFSLAVLTAYGMDVNDVGKNVVRIAVAAGGLLTSLLLVLTLTKVAFDARLGVSALVAVLLAATLAMPLTRRAGGVWLILLALLELGNVSGYGFQPQDNPNSLLKKLSEHSDIAEFLRKEPGPVRVELDDQAIPYNFGDWYGIDHFGGYLASLTQDVARLQGSARVRAMYGVNYWIGKQASRPDQEQVFESRSGLKVYRNPGALPRTWIVHEAYAIGGAGEIDAALHGPAADPRKKAFLRGPAPQLESCAALESSRMLERSANRVVIEANLRCRGMVILGETYAPGWAASVDGRAAPVHEVCTLLRGVVAEAGTHRIVLSYRPKSVYTGAALTGLGLLGAALLLWRKS